jgi:predicted nucleotidyltransferase
MRYNWGEMVSSKQIIQYVDRIVARFKPRRVVLFGSYAWGRPTEDSDVDLLITRKRWSGSPLTEAGRIRVELGVAFAMDLIVRTEGEVERGVREGHAFVDEMLEKGLVLYAADDARVGGEGRKRLRRRLRGVAVAEEIAVR